MNLSAELVGGKGYQLQFLQRHGHRVPNFFIVTTDQVQEILRTGVVPDAITQMLSNLSSKWFAVRSSVNAEDGVDHSFAGLFETFLYVSPQDVAGKIIEASRALGSERVLAYCREKKIERKLAMALVVQEMIDPTSAGVCFSRAPIAPTADILIDASWGVGEGVVSGLVEADHWRYSRFLELKEEIIADKPQRLGLAPEQGGTRSLINDVEKQSQASLTIDQRLRLMRHVLQIEKQFGGAVDVEWAFVDDVLYFLQVRAITQSFPPIKTYTDTNLAESYPGVTSPFTASFVKVAYRNVFAESAVLMGASTQRLTALMPHYDSLIAEVDHHLYYDLEHYYAVLSALPGGEKNIENWHRMIGGKKKGMDVPLKLSPLKLSEQLKALYKLLALIWTQDKVLSRFCETLEVQKKLLREDIQNSQSAQETLKALDQSLSRPMGFGLTVLNDVILMIGIKGLTSLLRTINKTEQDLALLLATGEEVESLKPLRKLQQVMQQIPIDFWLSWRSALVGLPDWSDSYPVLWQKLQQEGWKNESALLTHFLDEYGDRSFEELKLESPTLKQSPVEFDRLLQFMRLQKGHESQQKTKASLSIDEFSGFKKLAWKWCWKVTKRSITWREHTRLLRGQFYNIIREMMSHAAKQLKAEYPRFQAVSWRDFFTPTLMDYRSFVRGELNEHQLWEIMQHQKSWQSQTKHFAEFLIIGEGEKQGATNEVLTSANELRGQVASQGHAIGKPLVLEHPLEAMSVANLSEHILVTRHTDPAWVYIMSQCRGLISEKGSLLSHTAIIGRELGVPTLVGVKGAMQALRDKKMIELNATQGKVSVHES